MTALLDPPVSPVSVNALTDVEALAIPRDLLIEQPSLACKVLRNLASRLAQINRVVMTEVSHELPGPMPN